MKLTHFMQNRRSYKAIVTIFILTIALYSCEAENEFVTPNNFEQTVKDIDGNEYSTISIYNQVWFAENLKTTRLNDSTPISELNTLPDLTKTEEPYFCLYNNDNVNKTHYGYLYNWYAVNTNKLCPKGWHVPSEDDWKELTDSLGGTTVAGGKLKQRGTDFWKDANTDATNSYSFSALPGGYRNLSGTYKYLGERGFWWSSTANDSISSWYHSIYYYSGQIYNNNFANNMGFSVRCIKDQEE